MAECTDIERALLDALREDLFATSFYDRAVEAGAPADLAAKLHTYAMEAEAILDAAMGRYADEILDGDRDAQ
jgi:hypothetical protein